MAIDGRLGFGREALARAAWILYKRGVGLGLICGGVLLGRAAWILGEYRGAWRFLGNLGSAWRILDELVLLKKAS